MAIQYIYKEDHESESELTKGILSSYQNVGINRESIRTYVPLCDFNWNIDE